MTKQEIYLKANSITGTTIDPTLFQLWLNTGYFEVMDEVRLLDTNRYIKKQSISLSSEQNEYELPIDCETIERLETSEGFKIPETYYDEGKTVHSELCWYRKGETLVVKNISSNFSATLHYWKKIAELINDNDTPEFPHHKYDALLVYYTMARYYMAEKADITGNDEIREYQRLLNQLKHSIRPVNEPKKPIMTYEDGL